MPGGIWLMSPYYWFGREPTVIGLVLFGALVFATVLGCACGMWRMLAGSWPPKAAVGVLALWLVGRIVIDSVRMMGYGFLMW